MVDCSGYTTVWGFEFCQGLGLRVPVFEVMGLSVKRHVK